jgi:transposase-like protein
VSEINKGLNKQVESFRSRPLEEVYPALWADTIYEISRQGGAMCEESTETYIYKVP